MSLPDTDWRAALERKGVENVRVLLMKAGPTGFIDVGLGMANPGPANLEEWLKEKDDAREEKDNARALQARRLALWTIAGALAAIVAAVAAVIGVVLGR